MQKCLTKYSDKKIKDFKCFENSHRVPQAVPLPQESGDSDVYPKQWENNVTARSTLGDGSWAEMAALGVYRSITAGQEKGSLALYPRHEEHKTWSGMVWKLMLARHVSTCTNTRKHGTSRRYLLQYEFLTLFHIHTRHRRVPVQHWSKRNLIDRIVFFLILSRFRFLT